MGVYSVMREIKQVVYSYNELSPMAQDKARYDFVNGSNRYVVEWKLKALLGELFGEDFNNCLEAEYAFNAGKKSGLNVYGKVPVRMLLSVLDRTDCRMPERYHFYNLDFILAREMEMIRTYGSMDEMVSVIEPLFDGEPAFFISKCFSKAITDQSANGHYAGGYLKEGEAGKPTSPYQALTLVYVERLCREIMKAVSGGVLRTS